jgi:hypothetical protein
MLPVPENKRSERTSMSKSSDPITFLEPFASFAVHLLDNSSVVAADDGAGQAYGV